MRNVAIVTPWFPNRPGLAAGSFVYDSALALARQGEEVSVLVARPWIPGVLEPFASVMNSGKIQVAAFTQISEIAEVKFFSLPRGVARRFSLPISDRRVCTELERLAIRQKSEVILAHTEGLAPACILAGRRLGIPVAIVIHGINTDPHYLFDQRQRSRLATALKAADRVILVGSPLRSFFADYIGREDHLRIVPNGAFRPAANPPEVFREGSEVRFISVSNLQEGKGINLTLLALAQLLNEGIKDWSYRIVGAGPERGKLETLAFALGLQKHVFFIGPLDHSAVPGALTEADAFVLPSYQEAFGIAYLEAMAMGRLAIGVIGQGPAQFIKHMQTGLLVPPRDERALAETLRAVITGAKSHWRGIAAAGAEEARTHWSWDAHATKLGAVLDEIRTRREW